MSARAITTSSRVRAKDFREPWFVARTAELGEPMKLHRKLWEFCVVAQVAVENGLTEHARVLGFGCGLEDMPSWFAKMGAYVEATDQPIADPLWTQTGQYGAQRELMWKPDICTWAEFDRQVLYRTVDMNDIRWDLLQGQYDLTWSCGSFEHLGSLERGLSFFYQQMSCLRPGGLAIHTTEFNAADGMTLENHEMVFFQQKHLTQLAQRLTDQGDRLWPLDLTAGDEEADAHIDTEPWGVPHLSLQIGGYVTTSVALIAQRGAH